MEKPEKRNLGDQAAAARASAMIGTIVSGRYRIVELIAMGGVGAVYLAEHVHMHKHVAVKLLHPDPTGGPDLAARFEREAVAGAHIQHANVAAATDFGRLDDGSSFLVLEYVRGITLRELIRRGPVSAARSAHIVRQIASALAAVHALGIVHRDVKPRNVMLLEGERDFVKLIDFGLAKLDLKQVSAVAASRVAFDEERITTSGAVFGTIAYLAPEAAMGMDQLDARADLYSLGIVLYELLSGKHPFDTKDPVELFRLHHKQTPPPVGARTPGVIVPPALEAVLMRLLEKAPEARYQSADEVILALDAASDVESASAAPVSLRGLTPIFPGPSLAPPGTPSSPTSSSLSLRAIPPGALDLTPSPSAMVTAPPPAPPAPALPAPLPAPVAPPAPPPSSASPARSGGPRRVPGGLVVVFCTAAALTSGALTFGMMRKPADGVTDAASATAATPSTATSTAISPAQRTDSPTTAPTASAAPPTTASSAPVPVATASAAPARQVDVTAERAALKRFIAGRDTAKSLEAMSALADAGPGAFADPTLLAPLRDLASSAAVTGGDAADRIFGLLEDRAGPDGLDALYEIVRTRGGSKGADRASAILAKPEVLARASPALRITVLLRTGSCDEKRGLLERAAAEGDERTIVVLETVVAVCFGHGKAVEDVARQIRRRAK